MMKRIFKLAFLTLALSGSLYGQAELTVREVTALPGANTVVPLILRGGEAIVALRLDIEFDAGILSIAGDGSVLGGDLLSDHGVSVQRQSGTLQVLILSATLTGMRGQDGSVIQMIFEVDPEVPIGTRTTLGLRQVQASDSQGNLVPIEAQNGELEVSDQMTAPLEGENRLVFPQIGNGQFPGGFFSVGMLFVNRTRAQSTGEIRFFRSDGTPLAVVLTDGRRGSSFEFTISANGFIILQTDGSGELTAGYAILDATAPLGGVLLFTTANLSGETVSQAGVGSSILSSNFSIPVLLEAGGVDTGIALANVSSGSVEGTIVLFNEAGQEVARLPITLETGEHRARLVSQLFELQEDPFRGSIQILVSAPLAAIAVQLTDAILTTFPVIQLP